MREQTRDIMQYAISRYEVNTGFTSDKERQRTEEALITLAENDEHRFATIYDIQLIIVGINGGFDP